jgi:hypothetical protein
MLFPRSCKDFHFCILLKKYDAKRLESRQQEKDNEF